VNMLICILAMTLVGSFMLMLSERNFLLVKTLHVWENRKRNAYLLDGLLMYGIALLKAKGTLTTASYELSVPYATYQAHLSYTLKSDSSIVIVGTLALDSALYKGSCTVSQKDNDIEIVSWLDT
jgi:hypothetical protein